ncbi:WSC2 [[Candida] subhashii]|uniref:WSC2 n=1 Tax=[Candida] subhashii TaxID=561895 RepID=A0A8J5QNR3_9ASCO|nr:WSC2 [[Candida] subhashii]KAG7663896.1 WSC2 [[Candida] subhashii]
MKSSLLLLLIPLIQPIYADVWVDAGCFAKSDVDATGGKVYQYQSSGYCQQQCLGKRVAAMINGNECYCGDTAPTNKVASSNCNMKCDGYPDNICGGSNYFTVYVNQEADDAGDSNSSSSSKGQTSSKTSATSQSSSDGSSSEPSSVPKTTVLSTVTSGSEPSVLTSTIFYTPSTTASQTGTQTSSTSTSDSSNKNSDNSKNSKLSSGGIAGAVVGSVAGIGLIIGLVFIFLRWKRKRDDEEFDDIFTLSGPKNDGGMSQPPTLDPNPFLMSGGYNNFDTSQQNPRLQPNSRVVSAVYGHDYKNSSSGGSAGEPSYNEQSDVGYNSDPNHGMPGSPPYPTHGGYIHPDMMQQPELGKRKLSAGSLPDMITRQPGGLKVVNN